MKNKLLFSFLLVVFLSVVFTLAITLFIYHGVYEERIEEDLSVELSYIKSFIERNEDLSGLMHFNRRITVVSSSGSVLFDNRAKREEMDNHLEREEIVEALSLGYGKSERMSKTLQEKSLYLAEAIEGERVVRISSELISIIGFMKLVSLPLVSVLFVVFFLLFIFSSFLSNRLIEPINSLNLDSPLSNDYYEELSPLLCRLDEEKKKVEEKILETEKNKREFDAITDKMNEGLAIVNKEGRILSSNSSFFSLLSLERGQDNIFFYLDNSELKRVVLSTLKGERCELTFSSNGKTIEAVSYPVEEKEGIVIIIRDISAKSEGEKRRREFTSNVSHELKTPLTTIIGFSEILKSESLAEERRVEFSSEIYREATRLRRIVSDILTLSSIDEKKEEEKCELDLVCIIEGIIKELEYKAKEKRVTITRSVEKIVFNSSEKLFHSIIYNTLDNAILYNKDGGSVFIEGKKVGNDLYITISDTGIGIPAFALDRVFERFYRVDKSHSTLTGGTGLGLSIVKNAARSLKGEVKIESKENEGTRITIILPL